MESSGVTRSRVLRNFMMGISIPEQEPAATTFHRYIRVAYWRRRMFEAFAALAASLGFALLCSWRILTIPGWIGMRHDWSVAPFPGEVAVWASDTYHGWFQNGTGMPLAYPNDWLILELYSWMTHVVPAMLLSKGTLVAVPFVASLSLYFFARQTVALPIASASIAAFVYAANPVLFNKMVAGQLAYLWGYALLPLWMLLYRIDIAKNTARLAVRLLAGLIAALISSQIQFVVFLTLLMLLDALGARRRLSLDLLESILSTVLLMTLAQLGSIVALYHSLSSLERALSSAPNLDWIRANSATLVQAFELRGYVTHYFSDSFRAIPLLGLLLPLVGAAFLAILMVAAFTALRRQNERVFALAWALGAFALSGVNAPFGRLIQSLYAHVLAMQMFREIYHWGVVAAFGAAMLIGVLCGRLVGSRHQVLIVPVAAIVLLYAAPLLTGNWAGQVQVVRPMPRLDAFYSKLRTTEKNKRIMWLPIDQPISPPDGRYAGLDPMSTTEPPSSWEYVLTPPISTIAIALRSHKMKGLNALLQCSAVNQIVLRKDFRSRVPDFAYHKFPQFRKTYAENADAVGLRALGWPVAVSNTALIAYRAPLSNHIVDTTAGFALVTPQASLLGHMERGLSPEFSTPLRHPGKMLLEKGDLATTVALYAPVSTDELGRAASFKSEDATKSWAPVSAWWFYRYALTDALDGSVISLVGDSGRPQEMTLPHIPQDSIVIVAFSSTKHGGVLGVRIGHAPLFLYNTRSKTGTHLRSVVIHTNRGGKIRIFNMRGEQVLRHVTSIRSKDWAIARLRFLRAVAHAGNVSIRTDRTFFDASAKRGFGGRMLALMLNGATAAHEKVNVTPRFIMWGNRASAPPGIEDVRVSNSGTQFTGTVPGGVHAIVLRTSFSRSWVLHLNQTPHIKHRVGDLSMNAWSFPPSPSPRSFTINYALGSQIAATHSFSAIGLAATCVVAILLIMAQNKDVTWWPL